MTFSLKRIRFLSSNLAERLQDVVDGGAEMMFP